TSSQRNHVGPGSMWKNQAYILGLLESTVDGVRYFFGRSLLQWHKINLFCVGNHALQDGIGRMAGRERQPLAICRRTWLHGIGIQHFESRGVDYVHLPRFIDPPPVGGLQVQPVANVKGVHTPEHSTIGLAVTCKSKVAVFTGRRGVFVASQYRRVDLWAGAIEHGNRVVGPETWHV